MKSIGIYCIFSLLVLFLPIFVVLFFFMDLVKNSQIAQINLAALEFALFVVLIHLFATFFRSAQNVVVAIPSVFPSAIYLLVNLGIFLFSALMSVKVLVFFYTGAFLLFLIVLLFFMFFQSFMSKEDTSPKE